MLDGRETRFTPLAGFPKTRYNGCAALPHTGNRKGVSIVEIVIAFLVSVGAGVVSYYVCKWLDRHSKGR